MPAKKVHKSRCFKRDRVRHHIKTGHKQRADVEFSQEAETCANIKKYRATQRPRMSHWSGFDVLAVVFSILSFFLFTIVLGIGGAILGIFSYLQGNRSLGIFAIFVALLAILIKFITMST